MNFNRFVVVAAVVFALTLPSPHLFAADKEDVVAAIHQFADNLDPKTMDKALAACDSPTSIMDEFPPHVWNGPNACADWFKAYNEYNEKHKIVPGDDTIGTPWSVDVAGDRAYVVAPATYAYKRNGKDVKELHAVFTAALRKTGDGWKITAWTWSKH